MKNQYDPITWDSSYSNFDVTKINDGDNNVVEDWNRLDGGPMYINGTPIKELIGKANPPYFNKEEELKTFFKEHLLKHLSLKREEEIKILNCLMNTLHQGGLLNPVSASALAAINGHAELGIGMLDARFNVGQEEKDKKVPAQVREVSFTTTPNGFIIQEILTQNKMLDMVNANVIEPDLNQNFVFQAQAELGVDLKNIQNGKPQIILENNFIRFGNKEVQAKLDNRNFLQKFWDAVRNILGLNTSQKIHTDDSFFNKPIKPEEKKPEDKPDKAKDKSLTPSQKK